MRRSLFHPEPTPSDSPAAHIARFAGRDRSTTNIAAQVVALADLWTLIAGEQIGALAHVVRNRDVFAIFPLLRSALEHSCYVVWLLDPDLSINPGARCARAALAVDRSNEEMATAVAHLRGRGSQAHHEYREALRRFRDEVRAAFPNEVEIDEQLTIAGERFPRPTDVIRQFGARWGEADEAEGVYDYLCTTATHPTLAALEWLAPVEGGGVVIDASMEALTRMLRAGLVPFLKAVEHYAGYCGFDAVELDAVARRSDELFGRPRFTKGPSVRAANQGDGVE